MIGFFTLFVTIGYYIYLWKARKVYEIDRPTLVLWLLLLFGSYLIIIVMCLLLLLV